MTDSETSHQAMNILSARDCLEHLQVLLGLCADSLDKQSQLLRLYYFGIDFRGI